jgi:hypothetical protein
MDFRSSGTQRRYSTAACRRVKQNVDLDDLFSFTFLLVGKQGSDLRLRYEAENNPSPHQDYHPRLTLLLNPEPRAS